MVEQKSGIDYNWDKDAACRTLTQKEKEDFFPIRGDGRGRAMIRKARKVCLGCPVLYECLHAALVTNEHYGVWGMSSPKQRLKLRRGKDADGNPLYLDLENIPALYEEMIGDMRTVRGGDMIEL
jgi:WhiB family redox-sensing transcriptional regulator